MQQQPRSPGRSRQQTPDQLTFSLSLLSQDAARLWMFVSHRLMLPMLLATQLHQHRTTRPLLDAALTLMAGSHLTVDQGSCIEPSSLLPRKLAVIPLLALLEGSTEDHELCHNALITLRQLFEKMPDLCETMMDNALVETLCNVLLVLYQRPPTHTSEHRKVSVSCSVEQPVNQEIVAELQEFLVSVAEKAFNSSGLTLYHHLDNCMVLLHSLESCFTDTYGFDSESVTCMRQVQCRIYQVLLEQTANREEASTSRFLSQRFTFSPKGRLALVCDCYLSCLTFFD